MTSLTSHDVLKMQFLRSTALEIYTASSYNVDKVVSIVRSDFRHPKLVKDTFTQYVEGLFTPDVCMTRALDSGTGMRNALHYGSEHTMTK